LVSVDCFSPAAELELELLELELELVTS